MLTKFSPMRKNYHRVINQLKDSVVKNATFYFFLLCFFARNNFHQTYLENGKHYVQSMQITAEEYRNLERTMKKIMVTARWRWTSSIKADVLTTLQQVLLSATDAEPTLRPSSELCINWSCIKNNVGEICSETGCCAYGFPSGLNQLNWTEQSTHWLTWESRAVSVVSVVVSGKQLPWNSRAATIDKIRELIGARDSHVRYGRVQTKRSVRPRHNW